MANATLKAVRNYKVTFRYKTKTWLDRLKQSFGTEDKAWYQCSLDWPRMKIVDNRTYVGRVLRYLRYFAGTRVSIAYFANQSIMVEPFLTLMHGFPHLLIVQCSKTPLSLVLEDDKLMVSKQCLGLDPAAPAKGPVAWFFLKVTVTHEHVKLFVHISQRPILQSL
ncbi:hypothetical protein OAM67_00885 [bacterium]|nr:hypothetical protein [bacterium]